MFYTLWHSARQVKESNLLSIVPQRRQF